ncbi:TATA element modulatory factor-like isoform X3 [Ostrinia furnacalis]|uniref:TATA element modulatory factor-like isoform X1 n=1 Tax=Ostrinia furnacalis TaxID=93504 RepID=UPI00103AE765|nr:TATA element modulatory factor-like isoform X1 [Ostrinia furnacalis]XP_028178760.1 TATA element modulatory factor-like isoform X2 [Ostrinia furnacalis]XP_028178761.1 TATA element modulatory factor-like isoform X1 [Ostrinia furnacalis]XP_028178762.1 TATA element modulatory factor-like isoform X3 [Ostrinia furnacalis]
MWPMDEGSITPTGAGAAASLSAALGVEDALTRRDGSLRALTAQLHQARAERSRACDSLAALQARLDDYQSLQEQYDALLQMYGEKEEQLSEARLDLADVTALYKAQLADLVTLRQQAR